MALRAELDVRPLSPLIGAEIHGVDISRPMVEHLVGEVRAVLNRYHVIFFRDQDLTPEGQAAFAAQFGEVTEAHPVQPSIPSHSQVLAIDAQEGDRASWWHTDVTFVDTPPLGSILHLREVPPVGGDTMWASLQDAYDRLAEPMRAMCDTLIAIHHDPWFAAEVEENGGYTWNGEFRPKLTPSIHPVVRTHPENGRKGLFVNEHFTTLILGMSPIESRGILDTLYRHCVQPEMTCRFRWEPGSVAFWDNRATMHYALDDFGSARRFGHRVTLRGDRPFGPAMPRA
jgi:taurine dioxygenase